MNSSADPTASGVNNAPCPLTTLLLLAATQQPQAVPDLLKPLGLSQSDLDAYATEHAATRETIKKMAIAGALLDRSTLAHLIRVRLGVKLIETEDPRQLAVLVTAAAKLPGWVFGEVDPQQQAKQSTNGVYHGSADQPPDISAMGLEDTVAEAKRLLGEMEQPATVQLR